MVAIPEDVLNDIFSRFILPGAKANANDPTRLCFAIEVFMKGPTAPKPLNSLHVYILILVILNFVIIIMNYSSNFHL